MGFDAIDDNSLQFLQGLQGLRKLQQALQCEGSACTGDGLDVCNANTDNDGIVNVHDVLFVLASFHGSDMRADLNSDLVVDIHDLLFVLGSYGSVCEISDIPVNAMDPSQAWCEHT
jgi:hypothetical protein